MAIRTILWTTTKKLECAPCPDSTADVIICLPATKVNYITCPLDPLVAPEVTPVGNYLMSTINGNVVNVSIFAPCNYRYTIEFDDVQLLPNTVITEADIIGVICRDCTATYIDQQAGNEVKLELIVENTLSKYRLTTQHGCQFEFLPDEELVSNIPDFVNTGPNNTYFDLTHLDLTPGEWEISGAAMYFVNGATLPSTGVARAGVSTTPGNSAAGLVLTNNAAALPFTGPSVYTTIVVPTHRIAITVNTRIYLKGYVQFTAGQPQFVATLKAYRITL